MSMKKRTWPISSNLDLIVLIKPPPPLFRGRKLRWNPPGN